MALCPALSDKIPLPILKDRTNASHHPWEKTIKSIYSNRIIRAHNSIRNPVYPEPKVVNYVNRLKFTVIGIRTCKEFIYCAHLVKVMHKYRTKTYDVPEIKGLSNTEWPSAFNDLKIHFGGFTYCITTPVIILINGKFFGGDQDLKEFMESKYIYRLCLDYRKEAMQNFYRYVKSTGRPFVFLDISIDEELVGPLIFMLYADIVPNTCENFLRLCTTTKGGYSGTPVHRIVKDGWIQCGGFGLKDTRLCCENFAVPHDKRGVLAMCNDNRDIDCSTQFYVLLQPADWMAHKYVAFGQLVDGEQILKKIENEPTFYESPTSTIIIERAGLLNLDCEDITINKRAREYINKHIEDLIETQEFLTELLMQHLWAEIEARMEAKKEQQAKTTENNTISDSSGFYVTPTLTDDKENEEFAVETYPSMYEINEHSHQVTVSLPSMKPEKPFFLPLTDVPYPGELDSTFDLKKFLKGDYCLESDLEQNLHKDDKQRDVIKIVYSKLSSDTFFFDQDESETASSSSEMDSSDEEHIRIYIRDNVDRASFAGNVIKNIGAVRKGQAFSNLFKGVKKSELPILTDDDLTKFRKMSLFERRQTKRSQIPYFSDEDLRRLRLASVFKRGPPTSYDHRQTSVLKKASPSEVNDVMGLTDEERDKLRDMPKSDESIQITTLEGEDGPNEQKPGTASEIYKKRRQTLFAEDIERVQSYQQAIPSKDASIESPQSTGFEKSTKTKITFPSSTLEPHTKIKRRQTGYVREKDLSEINIKLEVDETDVLSDIPKVRIDPTVKSTENAIHRRPTAYVRNSEVLKDEDDDDEDETQPRKSVLLRLYEDSLKIDMDAPPPTLKNYRPLSETTPDKNMFLTVSYIHFDSDTNRESLRRTQNIDIGGSYLQLPNINNMKKTGATIWSEYVPATSTLAEMEKRRAHRRRHSRRPFITVEDYQKKNQERLEKIKEEEFKAPKN